MPFHSLRWGAPFMCQGQNFDLFWREYLSSQRDVLWILGQGFDPRMTLAWESLLTMGGAGKRDCLLIAFDEGPNSPSLSQTAFMQDNLTRLGELMRTIGEINTRPVEMMSSEGVRFKRVTSVRVVGVLSDAAEFSGYSDVVIDISAMPRSVIFPLVAKALHTIDNWNREILSSAPNLHIIACENALLDTKVYPVSPDESAEYVYGFRGSVDEEIDGQIPRVWIPLLGTKRSEHLEKISDLVRQEETCPLLPFPARDPRQPDRLLLEYREVLDRWRVETRNITYAAQDNPFAVYRQIMDVISRYRQSLALLEGCKITVSALSGKTAALGALLAAYEAKVKGWNVGLAHLETLGYEMAEYDANIMNSNILSSFWLAGEPYDQG